MHLHNRTALIWKSFAILILVSVMASVCIKSTYASSTTPLYDSFIVNEGNTTTAGEIIVRKLMLYSDETTIREVGTGVEFSTSISNILRDLPIGELGAVKDAFFDSEADREKGIVKIVFDIAGAPPAKEPINLLFVVDESGSMNMYSDAIQLNGIHKSTYTVPCLNNEHYYKIRARVRIGDTVYSEKTYDIYPNDYANMSTWTLEEPRELINAMKADVLERFLADTTEDPTEQELIRNKMAESANTYKDLVLLVDNYGGRFESQNLGELHYCNDEHGNAVNIPVPVNPTRNDGDDTNDVDYYSPSTDNEYGCYDRMMLAMSQLKDAAEVVLRSSNNQSSVGYVGFAGEVISWSGLESRVPEQLSQYLGHDHTNYADALNQAYTILSSMTDEQKEHPTYVIFVTDGTPNQPTNPSASARTAAAALKNFTYTSAEGKTQSPTIFTAGIASGASDLLRDISSYSAEDTGATITYYKDCKSANEFRAFIGQIEEYIAIPAAAVVVDIIGDAYDIICDANHPLYLRTDTEEVTFPNLTATDVLTEHGITVISENAEGKQMIQWEIVTIDNGGARLSFFVQLNESQRDALMNGNAFDTNERASVVYQQVNSSAEEGEPAQEERTIILDNPATLRMHESTLTLIKTAKDINSDALPDESVVSIDDEITYDLKLVNKPTVFTENNTQVARGIDIQNIKVRDVIPQGAVYVTNTYAADSVRNPSSSVYPAGATGSDVQWVDFELERLPWKTVSETSTENEFIFTLTVKVDGTTITIWNNALFGAEGVTGSISDSGAPMCYSNPVYHFLKNRPLQVNKTVTGDLGIADHEFTFTVMLEFRDNKPVANQRVMAKYMKADGTTEDVVFEMNSEGKATFTLKHNESMLIIGVPEDGAYAVEEGDYSSQGYTTTSMNASGVYVEETQENNGAIEVDFYNNRSMVPPTGLSKSDMGLIAIVVFAAASAVTAVVIVRRRKAHDKI